MNVKSSDFVCKVGLSTIVTSRCGHAILPVTCLLPARWPWPPWQSRACPGLSSGWGVGRKLCCSWCRWNTGKGFVKVMIYFIPMVKMYLRKQQRTMRNKYAVLHFIWTSLRVKWSYPSPSIMSFSSSLPIRTDSRDLIWPKDANRLIASCTEAALMV